MTGSAPVSATDAWPSLLALPAPRPLLPGYDRHAPDDALLGEQLDALAFAADWAGLGWSALIEELLALGRTDVPLSRLVEGHVDAVRILDQADRTPVPGARYGVWASRSLRTGVTAERVGEDLVLAGTIRFASGAGVIDRALVPVWTGPEEHLLVDLPVRELAVDGSGWVTAAMAVTRSLAVNVGGLRLPGTAVVGGPGFYLGRPGFFPGGIGVAACWAGGAARVLDLTVGRLHRPLAPELTRRLGVMALRVHTAVAVVRAAGADLERLLPPDGPSADADWLRLAAVARAAVADAGHDVLAEAVRIGGPAGLSQDVDLTRAIDDLRLYLLQQNADGDAALLGDRALG